MGRHSRTHSMKASARHTHTPHTPHTPHTHTHTHTHFSPHRWGPNCRITVLILRPVIKPSDIKKNAASVYVMFYRHTHKHDRAKCESDAQTRVMGEIEEGKEGSGRSEGGRFFVGVGVGKEETQGCPLTLIENGGHAPLHRLATTSMLYF